MSRQQLPHHQPASQASCPTTYRTTRQLSRMSSLLPTNSSSRRSRKGPWMCLSTLACCWPWVRINTINIIKATAFPRIASFCCGSPPSGNSITRIRILCNKSGKESQLTFFYIIWNFLILVFSLIYDKLNLLNLSIIQL